MKVTNDVLVKIVNFPQISWEVATKKLTYFRSISKWSQCSNQRLSKVIVHLKSCLILVTTNILSREVARFHCRSTQGRVRMSFKARKSPGSNPCWSHVCQASDTSWIFEHGKLCAFSFVQSIWRGQCMFTILNAFCPDESYHFSNIKSWKFLVVPSREELERGVTQGTVQPRNTSWFEGGGVCGGFGMYLFTDPAFF